jgi:FKBP-type peptidyl-prolyl cis-trans isomerase (trigger factor)
MGLVSTARTNASLSFSYEPIVQHLTKVTITVPASLVDMVYAQTSRAQQQSINTYGFDKGQTPVSYIEQNYRSHLLGAVQEFLLQYFVLSFLYQNIMEHGLLVAGDPRFISIHLDQHQDAVFVIELSTWPSFTLQAWKNFPFKAPKRKNYKDIDRQVQSFIKEEQTRLKQWEELDGSAQIGDWICFSIALSDADNTLLLGNHQEYLWLRIGDEEADSSLRSCFIGKQVGDSFYSQDSAFQEYFHQSATTDYFFHITITHIIPYAYVCFEAFKRHFRLQNKKDLHQKLIEVFSFRNDLSQRRATAEEALRLLLAKHSFKIPNHFSLREQQEVLEKVRLNPDYNVYKTQPNFKDYLRKLAEKQVKEALMIDYIAHEEGITASYDDLICYLNLTKRPRMKEFLYFAPPSSKIQGQETPIPMALLQVCCRREKALNHIIYHLSKQ